MTEEALNLKEFITFFLFMVVAGVIGAWLTNAMGFEKSGSLGVFLSILIPAVILYYLWKRYRGKVMQTLPGKTTYKGFIVFALIVFIGGLIGKVLNDAILGSVSVSDPTLVGAISFLIPTAVIYYIYKKYGEKIESRVE